MKEKGTVFDFKESEGDWFDFFESHVDFKTGEIEYDDPVPGTGRACFKSTLPFIKEYEKKRKPQHKFVLNEKTRQMERVNYYEPLTPEEEQEYLDNLYDYAITGLERFFDSEGNALACTRENKLKLAKVPVFDRFMARCLELRANASRVRTAASEKNLKTP